MLKSPMTSVLKGVGMTWVSTLQKHISENLVSDEEFKTVEQRFPNNPPQSKEEYYYRSIFIQSYLLTYHCSAL